MLLSTPSTLLHSILQCHSVSFVSIVCLSAVFLNFVISGPLRSSQTVHPCLGWLVILSICIIVCNSASNQCIFNKETKTDSEVQAKQTSSLHLESDQQHIRSNSFILTILKDHLLTFSVCACVRACVNFLCCET